MESKNLLRHSQSHILLNEAPMVWCAGILVPISDFGQGCNKLGITQSSWQTCYSCSSPLGNSTAIGNGSAYDQLDSFRSDTFSKMCSQNGRTCQFVAGYPLSVASPDFQESQMTVNCGTNLDNATISIDIDGRTFGLVPVTGNPVGSVVDAVLMYNQTHLDLLANVTNPSGVGNFSLLPVSCCSMNNSIYTCTTNISFLGPSKLVSSGGVVPMAVTVTANSDSLQTFRGCQVQLVLHPREQVQAVFYVPVTFPQVPPPPPPSEVAPAPDTPLIGSFTLSFLPSPSLQGTLNQTDMNAVQIRYYRCQSDVQLGVFTYAQKYVDECLGIVKLAV
jgi:hypothetical protein